MPTFNDNIGLFSYFVDQAAFQDRLDACVSTFIDDLANVAEESGPDWSATAFRLRDMESPIKDLIRGTAARSIAEFNAQIDAINTAVLGRGDGAA